MDFDDTAKQSWDLIFNATSAGLQGHSPPLPKQVITRKTVVYDLQYGEAAAPFCGWAAKLGAQKILTGWGTVI